MLIACNGVEGETLDLTHNLVSHYLLNNNADDSWGTNDGVTVSGVDFQGDTAKGDGATARVNTPTLPLLKTLSLWCTFPTDAISYIIGLDTATDESSLSTWNGGSAYYQSKYIGGDDLLLGLLSTFNAGQYYNFTITTDGTTLKGYVDGVLVDTALSTHLINVTTFMYHLNEANRRHSGNLSNVRCYSDAKSQAFVDLLYAEGYYPKPLPLPTEVGLVARYPLTGTAEDTTGNYDGVESGGFTYVDDAEFGAIASFDGVDGKMPLSPSVVNGQSSGGISFNVKGSSNIVLSFSDNANDDHFLYIKVTNIVTLKVKDLTNGIENVIESTFNTISSTEWSNIAVLSTGTAYKIYINGVETAVIATTGVNDGKWFSSVFGDTLNVGSIDNFFEYFFAFKLSNLRVYNRALTAQEILDIYNYEKHFRPIDIDDGLVAYYPLANNSLDNYHNELDGVDTNMTYDGLGAVFNGSSSKITITPLPDINNYSLSFWLTMNSQDVNAYGIYWGGEYDMHFSYSVILGLIRFSSYSGVEDAVAYTSPPIGVATHYVITYTDEVLSMFVNGVLVDSLPLVVAPLTNTEDTTLGGRYTLDLDGSLAHFRTYSKGITPEQVEVIYNIEKGDFI